MSTNSGLLSDTDYEPIEGKTKIVTSRRCSFRVSIFNKDSVSRLDGAEIIAVPNKGAFVTRISCKCFRLLEESGVNTHFVRQLASNVFEALEMRMIPIEVVIRRETPDGSSFLKRHPGLKKTTFIQPRVEFFFKGVAEGYHDPIMFFNGKRVRWELHVASKPLGTGFLKFLLPKDVNNGPQNQEDAKKMKKIARKVFLILERAFKKQGFTLLDLKIEFGIWIGDLSGFNIIVADVIDADSFRVLDENQVDLSKQVFRDAKEITPELIRKIQENYIRIAEITNKF